MKRKAFGIASLNAVASRRDSVMKQFACGWDCNAVLAMTVNIFVQLLACILLL